MISEIKDPGTMTRTVHVDERSLLMHGKDQIIRHMIDQLVRAVVADLKPKVLAGIDLDEIIQATKIQAEAQLKEEVMRVLRPYHASRY